MTAFGRGQSLDENEDFLVEIHSVNSRRLEIIVNVPGELTEFDPPLRKLVREAVSRGRVTVFVSCQPAYERGQALVANTEMARQLKRAYEELRKSLGYKGALDFSILASRPDLIVPAGGASDPESRWANLKTATEKALSKLIIMKETEGENLRPVFQESLSDLQKMVALIQEHAPDALAHHIERLKAKINEASPGLGDNEERILREVAILADKLDISEEIARLESHIQQFLAFMEDAEPCGRRLDFLLQEMNREINTIGAKAADLTISKLVVRGKTELEKLREQSHNIE